MKQLTLLILILVTAACGKTEGTQSSSPVSFAYADGESPSQIGHELTGRYYLTRTTATVKDNTLSLFDVNGPIATGCEGTDWRGLPDHPDYYIITFDEGTHVQTVTRNRDQGMVSFPYTYINGVYANNFMFTTAFEIVRVPAAAANYKGASEVYLWHTVGALDCYGLLTSVEGAW